jgi:protein TilB
VGNPCSQYEGYRDFVIHILPQLNELDSKQIERSERIRAAQKMQLGLKSKIIEQQEKYQGMDTLIKLFIFVTALE